MRIDTSKVPDIEWPTPPQPRPDKYYSWDVTSKTWAMTDAALAQKSADLIADAELRRTTSLSAAGIAISPLQDAVDLGMATDVETRRLTEMEKNIGYC